MSHHVCPHCDYELDEDDTYCVQCGEELPSGDDFLYHGEVDDSPYDMTVDEDIDEFLYDGSKNDAMPTQGVRNTSYLQAYVDLLQDPVLLSLITPFPAHESKIEATKGLGNCFYDYAEALPSDVDSATNSHSIMTGFTCILIASWVIATLYFITSRPDTLLVLILINIASLYFHWPKFLFFMYALLFITTLHT